jgi:hypothetical protein
VRALTVQQPWAWAIIHGGKDVENRTAMWSYRGPLAIHAGRRLSDRGFDSPLVRDAMDRWPLPEDVDPFPLGAFVGVVDVVDAHECVGGSGMGRPVCCDSAWAEASYLEHGGKTRAQLVHYVLENPRELAAPFRCRGKLGLWTPPPEALELLEVL